MSSKHTPGTPPKTLTVVLADTTSTYIAVVHENEHRPYTRRTVQVELTDEQREALTPRSTGWANGSEQHEIVLDCWLEPTAGAERDR